MNDETYYTVLNVKETASPSEIKTAYRDLIKQVHPDTIATLAPYLRRIAEDKAKEVTEAYTVLSNPSKRRDYDRQLAAYRRQNAPQAPPSPPPTTPPPVQQATSQTSSGPYCNRCGTPLYASGFCPNCKCGAAVAGGPTPAQAAPTSAPAATGGSSALKIILIVIVVIVVIGILGVATLGFIGYRFQKNLGVGIYPGAQWQKTSSGTLGGFHSVAADLESSDSVDKICSFYKSKFPGAIVTSSDQNRCTIVSSDKKNMITINVEASGNATRFQITNVSKNTSSN